MTAAAITLLSYVSEILLWWLEEWYTTILSENLQTRIVLVHLFYIFLYL